MPIYLNIRGSYQQNGKLHKFIAIHMVRGKSLGFVVNLHLVVVAALLFSVYVYQSVTCQQPWNYFITLKKTTRIHFELVSVYGEDVMSKPMISWFVISIV